MPYQIVRNDITKMEVDIIVNSANPLGGVYGGVDKAIQIAGGEELRNARFELGNIDIAQVMVTEAYNMPSKQVIHTVGPIWEETPNAVLTLKKTYQNILDLALTLKCESIAFPLISSGTFAFPKDIALMTAQSVILNFLNENDMYIYLVVYDKESFTISQEFRSDVKAYISSSLVKNNRKQRNMILEEAMEINKIALSSNSSYDSYLENKVFDIDEGFSKTLLKLIDLTGQKDPVIYKKANIDRKLFSKIKSNKDYQPSKNTALAFAIALELTLDEANDFIGRAGYVLSESLRFDVIVKYFIKKQRYDIFEVNNTLFSFDQDLLGSK